MGANFAIEQDLIAEQNKERKDWLAEDFDHLGRRLLRRGIDIESAVEKARGFKIAIPSWGVGTGGTRFARFPGPGEPRNIFEQLEDCGVIHALCGATPAVSLHLPWDQTGDFPALKSRAAELGLSFDAVNSNTFKDRPGRYSNSPRRS